MVLTLSMLLHQRDNGSPAGNHVLSQYEYSYDAIKPEECRADSYRLWNPESLRLVGI
jgi:hypothetical protein